MSLDVLYLIGGNYVSDHMPHIHTYPIHIIFYFGLIE